MATATKQAPRNGDVAPAEVVKVQYKPLAESDTITVTMPMVRSTLCTPSRSGKLPSDRDVITYMMLCKSRRLNPFVGDAFLIGYDGDDGTSWSLITAVQALRKRAESHPQYDGCQRGVILLADGEMVEREGSITLDQEQLVGGWAVCYRKDQKQPYRETVKFSVYSTGRSRWNKDPGGMIAKCAEAAALRRAFPSDCAGLYLAEEFDSENRVHFQAEQEAGMEGLRNRLAAVTSQPQRQQGEVIDADYTIEDEKTVETESAAPTSNAITDYWRGELRKAKTNKQRGDVLSQAVSQCDQAAMRGLHAFAEELATAK